MNWQAGMPRFHPRRLGTNSFGTRKVQLKDTITRSLPIAIFTKNGEYRHLEWNCIRRDDYIYCAARDVTEYYVEQEVLRQMVACSTRAMKDSSEIDFKAICGDMSIISQSPLVILLTQKEGEFAFEALACSKDMPQEVEEYLRDKNSFTRIEQKHIRKTAMLSE